MARLPPAHAKDKRIAELLEFCDRLRNALEANKISPDICKDLKHRVADLSRGHLPSSQQSTAHELDQNGTAIWNLSTRLRRDAPHQCDLRLYPQLRAFATFLLESAHRLTSRDDESKSSSNAIRVLRTALKAAQTCLDGEELDLCQQIFEKVVHYLPPDEPAGSQAASITDDNSSVIESQVAQKLRAEYWLLRVLHSSKQGRPDLALLFLPKVSLQLHNPDWMALAEKQADLTYDIGQSLLARKLYVDAMTWLRCSCETLDRIDDEVLSPDAYELRFSAMHDLASALIATKDPDSIHDAAGLTALLEQEHSNKVALPVLKLKLLATQDPTPAPEYQKVIGDIINTAVINENTFNMIMHHIQKLTKMGSSGNELACTLLDRLLEFRLYKHGDVSFIEKTLVTRIHLVTSCPSGTERITALSALLDQASDDLAQPLQAEAAHAAQSLIWKAAESAPANGRDDRVEELVSLANHRLFDRCGDLNKSKIARKRILIALNKGDDDSAREAYSQMPESGRDFIVSKYLMYKVGIRTKDDELATKCLDALATGPRVGKDKYLFACVLEAQQFGTKQHVLTALKRILHRYGATPPPGVYLPALLRVTMKLQMEMLDTEDFETVFVLEEICKLLEAAASQSKNLCANVSTPDDKREEQHKTELDWFGKHAYNLALKYCATLPPDLVVRLLNTSIHFVKLILEDSCEGPEPMRRLLRRQALCHFIAASALIVHGRCEDVIETSLQSYLEVHKHVLDFQELVKQHDGFAGAEADNGWANKRVEMIKYDLEAIVKLERWNDLDAVLCRCNEMQHLGRIETLADLLIVVHTQMGKANVDQRHVKKIPVVMQKIINQAWKDSGQDLQKLARWIRCVFRMTIGTEPSIALSLLEQASTIYGRTKTSSRSSAYPDDEIEWLACTAFDHAIDLYCAMDREGCGVWGDKALNLAMALRDERKGLYKTMEEKWLLLKSRENF